MSGWKVWALQLASLLQLPIDQTSKTMVKDALRSLQILFTGRHPVAQAYLKARKQLAIANGIDGRYVDDQPVDLRRNSPLVDLLAHSRAFARALRLSDIAVLLLRRWVRACAEGRVVRGLAGKPMRASSLTCLEQSVACAVKLMDPERLSHPMLLGLYPLVVAVDGVLDAYVSSEGCDADEHGGGTDIRSSSTDAHAKMLLLLRRRDMLWDWLHTQVHAHTREFDIAEACVRWQSLAKAINAFSSALSPPPSSSSSLMMAITHSLNISARVQHSLEEGEVVGVTDTLWKRGGHPTLPRSLYLQELEQNIMGLDAKLAFDFDGLAARQQLAREGRAEVAADEDETTLGASPKSNGNRDDPLHALVEEHPWFCVHTEWKRVLVEALSNVRFLSLSSS